MGWGFFKQHNSQELSITTINYIYLLYREELPSRALCVHITHQIQKASLLYVFDKSNSIEYSTFLGVFSLEVRIDEQITAVGQLWELYG